MREKAYLVYPYAEFDKMIQPMQIRFVPIDCAIAIVYVYETFVLKKAQLLWESIRVILYARV